MRLTTLFAIVVAVLAFAPPARADHRIRRILEESVRIEEARAGELDHVAASDARQARELEEAAQHRESAAVAAEQRAASMREMAAESGDHHRHVLEKFAGELLNFARADREEAAERRKAAEILVRSARRSEEGARFHREHVARMREHLERFREEFGHDDGHERPHYR